MEAGENPAGCESGHCKGVKYRGCPHLPGETSGKSNTNTIVRRRRTRWCIKDSLKDMAVDSQAQHKLKTQESQ